MTLTALTRKADGALKTLNPSLEIEADPKLEAKIIGNLRATPEFFCPHCYDKTREFFPVRMRNPENKRVHFYHPNTDSDKGCANYSPESEKHRNAKLAIAHYLRINGYAETVWNEYDEDIKRVTLPGLNRHPDILAMMPNGSLIVHEIQASPITPEELKQRTEDYRSCIQSRISQVVWYMGAKAYTRENRQMLRGMTNVQCFRLYFENSDANFPKWKEDDIEIERKSKPGSAPKDNCQISPTARTGGGLTAIGDILAKDPVTEWLRKNGWNPNTKSMKKGAAVRGAPGRASENWTGVIVGNEPFADGRDYFQVRWMEREKHKEGALAKAPVIGQTADQIVLIDKSNLEPEKCSN
jgi:hypothetical protein